MEAIANKTQAEIDRDWLIEASRLVAWMMIAVADNRTDFDAAQSAAYRHIYSVGKCHEASFEAIQTATNLYRAAIL